MKKIYYLEIYDVDKGIWIERENHSNINYLYDTMCVWVNEGYMGITIDCIRITEGWELV